MRPSQVKLKWIPPIDNGGRQLTGFRILRNGGGNDAANILVCETSDHEQTDCDESGLDPNRISKFALITRNDGADSEPYEIEIQPTTLPGLARPPLLHSASGDLGSLTLRLNPPADTGGAQIWHFELRYGHGVGIPSKKIFGDMDFDFQTQEVLPKFLEMRNLVKGRVYRFYVKYATIVGWSKESEELSLLCCEKIATLAKVVGLRRHPTAVQSASQISLLWDPAVATTGSGSLTHYRVFVDKPRKRTADQSRTTGNIAVDQHWHEEEFFDTVSKAQTEYTVGFFSIRCPKRRRSTRWGFYIHSFRVCFSGSFYRKCTSDITRRVYRECMGDCCIGAVYFFVD